jgi:hypothetical protein
MPIRINDLNQLYNYLIQDDNLDNSNYIQLIYIYTGSNCRLLKDNLHFLFKLLAFISNKINNNNTNVDQVRIYLIDEIKKILLRINNCNSGPFIPFKPLIIQNTPMTPFLRPQPFTPGTPMTPHFRPDPATPFLAPQPFTPGTPGTPHFRPEPVTPFLAPQPFTPGTPATPHFRPDPVTPFLRPQPFTPGTQHFRPEPRTPFGRPDPRLFPDAPRPPTTRVPRELGVARDQEDCPIFAKRQFLNHDELVDYLAPKEASIKADDDGLFIENADGTRCNTKIKFDPDNELYEIIDA